MPATPSARSSSLAWVHQSRGRIVECWSGALDNTNDPYFTLNSGMQGCVVIADLHSDRPTTLPDQRQFDLGKKPGVANTFGDAISAIRFR